MGDASIISQASGALSLEERKLVQESELKNRELALKEREVAAKEIELQRSRWLNPTVVGLIGVTAGLFGNLVVALIGNTNSQQVERSRAQSSLIVSAVGTGDATSACRNLLSFLRLGLLEDPKGTISRCESTPGSIPVLPSGRTYTPVADVPAATEMAPLVTRTDTGDTYRFDVTFTIPAPVSPWTFDLIMIYAYQIDAKDNRSGDRVLPKVQGNWKVGDRVTVSASLPKAYVDDRAYKSYLRFCVGSEARCMPGPNLLLPGSP